MFPTDLTALGLLCVSQKRDSVFLVLHPSVSLGPETACLFLLRITQTSGAPWLRLGPAKHHQFCLCPHLAKMCCLTSPFTKSCRQIAAAWDHTWESGSSPLYSSFRLSNCPACPPSHRWETRALARPGLGGSEVCFVCPAPKEQDPPWQFLCSRLQTEA